MRTEAKTVRNAITPLIIPALIFALSTVSPAEHETDVIMQQAMSDILRYAIVVCFSYTIIVIIAVNAKPW